MGEMVGDCGLTMQNINGTIKPEIGYHLRRDVQHKGLAREAAMACRDWTFENTPFNAVYSYMKRDNTPSSGVAMANGMKLVEEFRDDEGEISSAYAITRQEWEKLKK